MRSGILKRSFTALLDSRERSEALRGLGEIAFQQQGYGEAARLAKQSFVAGGGIPARVLLASPTASAKPFTPYAQLSPPAPSSVPMSCMRLPCAQKACV